MTRPIGSFLAEFDRVEAPGDLAWAAALPAGGSFSPEADRAAEIEAARREGEAEGRQQGEAAAEERCRMLGEAYEVALAASRAEWVAQEGEALAEALRGGFAALEASLAADIAAALEPLVEPALRSRAIAGLRAALADLTAGGEGALITVKAPSDIVQRLAQDWGGHPAVTLAVAEGDDAVVEAGATTIRSQTQAWSDRFRDACGMPA